MEIKVRIRLLLFLLWIFSASDSLAQKKFWVSFNCKGTEFNPYSYFSPRTIEQRLKFHINLQDSTDFPVNEKFLSIVRKKVMEMRGSSRWLNGVAVIATDRQAEMLRQMTFVKSVEELITQQELCSHTFPHFNELKLSKQKLLQFQWQRMQGEKFRDKNVNGQGVRIAVFDAGFPHVDKHPAFAHLFKENRIVATYDFVRKREKVYSHNAHGTATLSCITGIIDSINIGMATGAEFLLARTEMAHREPFSEEENWLAAVEWADRNGANIISSSLGYTYQRYFTINMDGKTSLVARAANMAASKGMLVICAAGNDGANDWHIIGTPADADSVIAVGGTNPYTDYKIGFSSWGPTSDLRMKPNVCAVADAIVATPKGYAEEYGTSFSTPLVAGFAACVWQMHRDWNNMRLFDELQKSAHLYPYFDFAHGFGIPQAGYFTDEQQEKSPTFDFVIVNNDMRVVLRDKYAHPAEERMHGYEAIRNLFYRVDGKDGRVKFYAVVLAEQKEVLSFDTQQFMPGDVLTVHFEGYTYSYTITGNEKP